MDLPQIDAKIKKLVNQFGTRDPFKIARELGVYVVQENLEEIYGYYNQSRKIKMVHINVEMNESDKLLTCAHELGHSILHPKENTPMLSKASITSELKIEKEANYFATHLIINENDDDLSHLCKFELLKIHGLPEEFERFL